MEPIPDNAEYFLTRLAVKGATDECFALNSIINQLRTELAATKEKLVLADKLADAAEERLKRWDMETYTAMRDALKAYREVGSE